MEKAEILKNYYNTDIDPTVDSLNNVITLCENFQTGGGDKLLYAIEMRNWKLVQINTLIEYITKARQRMERELMRLKNYKYEFNSSFATDHNDYYNTVAAILKHMRSHTAAYKEILKKTCTTKHPDKKTCQRFNIKQKSIHKESVLAHGTYEKSIFNINDPSIPEEVRTLFSELQAFFNNEKECFNICKEIITQENTIKSDPKMSNYLLNKYRDDARKRLKSTIRLISDDVVEMLQDINPAYKLYKNSSSEELFAQKEFHKHNTDEMDHFCIIEMASAKQKFNLETDEIKNWGTDATKISKIRNVVAHFDELLPSDFSHKDMGKYIYFFCKWALPTNIKQAHAYFLKHYHGKHKPSQYAAVNAHAKEWHKDNEFERSIAAINEK